MPATYTDRLEGLTTSVAVKAPCQAVAIANITLSGEQTVNGVAVTAGDRVLATAQTNSVDNGIWVVGTGTWARAKDFDGTRDAVQGTLVSVFLGGTESVLYQITTADPIVIGTTALTFEPATWLSQVAFVTADEITSTNSELDAITAKLAYQHSAVAPTYLTIKNKLKEGVSIQNFGGVIGNATANTTAFNDFAEAVEDTGFGKLKIPYGTWEINDAVDLAPNSLATGMEIEGDHKEYSLITVNGDIAMFTHGSGLKVRNLGFRQLGTSGTGRAFSTTSTGEASYCSYEACDFYDFKFGILHRKSIWNSFRNLGLFECKAGIRLARNDSYTDQTNPNASSGWNTGWYNNQIVFDNIVVDGGGSGEVGIWAAGMGLTFNTVTVQGLDGTGGSNVVLPSGEVGTGIWLDGGQTSDMSWNNVLLNIYAENTRRPLKFVDQRHVLVDGFFLQGSAVGTPFEYGVHLVNATATLQAVTGQDYFENMAKLESSSTLYGRLPGFGTVSNYDADSTSLYYNNEHQVESFVKKYTFSKTDSSTTTTFTVPVDFQDNTSYRVTINGYTDSSPDSNKRQVAYDISRINSATSTSKDISSGTETNFTSAIVGRNIVFTVTTALRFDATVTVEKFGEFPSQSAVITGV